MMTPPRDSTIPNAKASGRGRGILTREPEKGVKKMFTQLRRLLVMTIVGIMATYSFTALAADDNLEKRLVGKWEGEQATKNNTFRRLVIESIKSGGDQLTASGRYGDAEKNGQAVDIKITTSGNDATLEFLNPAGNRVTLKLVGDRNLDGVVRTFVGRRMVDADLHLRKVE